MINIGRFVDLTGMRFGRLTVLSRADDRISSKGFHFIMWNCLCDCGEKRIVGSTNLKRGITKSCGCYRKEKISELKKKYNEYNLSGSFGIGYATNNQKPFYFDLSDFDKIKDIAWYMDENGYLVNRNSDTNITLLMHRVILNPNEDEEVDHLSHKTWDNRKENLFIKSHQENIWNIGLRSTNTSGFTGVHWAKRERKWHAFLKTSDKTYSLGYYDNKEDAIKARLYAEEKQRGKHSYNNIQEKLLAESR